MKGSKLLIVVIVSSTMLLGCATPRQASYVPPASATYENHLLLNSSYDDTWNALVDVASTSFFAINTFEKDSGLMTLDFSSNPSRFVDCGIWNENGLSGPYLAYLADAGYTVNLQGKMNLRVSSTKASKTSVTVNARYILTASYAGLVQNIWTGNQLTNISNTWSFDSKGSEKIKVRNPTSGVSPYRTCRPTGVAEREIIGAVEQLL